MLQLITDGDEVDRVQKRLELALAKGEKFNVQLGHQGGTYNSEVYWFEEQGLWAGSKPINTRYWNTFGLKKPYNGALLHIGCEINFSYEATQRKAAGVLANDAAGRVYIGHRGNIGGGRVGVGKRTFLQHFTGDFMALAGEKDPVAFVGDVDSPRLIHHLTLFVQQVAQFKKMVNEGALPKRVPAHIPLDRYRPEFEGTKEYEFPNRIVASCDHALVTNRLKEAFASSGFRVANDRRRDLVVISSDGKIIAQFEVKSEPTPYSVYTALGQLLYHAPPAPNDCRLVAVLPKGLRVDARARMATLGIDVLEYELTADNTGVRFLWPEPTVFLNGRG